MVRDEAGRYLRSALEAWQQFADEIIAYDDNSHDDTHALLEDACARFVPASEDAAWGNEAGPRAALWQAALHSRCDWLFWLDADMVPAADVRDLQARDVQSIAFRLYDIWHWQSLQYRVDGHWQAHLHPRVWMVRRPQSHMGWQWNERGIHCGHLPANYALGRTLVAPQEYSILHYGYAEHSERRQKHAQYMQQARQLSSIEYQHADSIDDETYVTFPLPFQPLWPLTHASAKSLSVLASDSSSTSSTHIGAASMPSAPLGIVR
jgi:hypothetical protein